MNWSQGWSWCAALAALAGLCGVAPADEPVIRFPPDAGVVDVTQAPYFAKGDGVSDDTAALQAALSEWAERRKVIYLPVGTYLVRDTLRWQRADGTWGAMLHLHGEHRDRTIIKLADAAPGFGADAPEPLGKPVIQTASGLRKEPGGKPDGNMAFGNSILNLTVDTGRDNPGATGIDYVASNWGSLRQVTIRSGDGAGRNGLSLLRMMPGPCLVQHLRVEGFDRGVAARWMEYCVTFDHLELIGQRQAGVHNTTNSIAIHRLRSRNSVPAIVQDAESGAGFITLVDAELRGGDGGRFAIESRGHLLLRGVTSEGYRGVVRSGSDTIEESAVASYTTAPTLRAWPDAPAFEPLPVDEAPEFHTNDFSQWASVVDFGATPNDDTGDGAAIQAALDSGKPVVYFPNVAPAEMTDVRFGWWYTRSRYRVDRTLVVPDTVRRIVGNFSELVRVPPRGHGPPEGQPLLRFENGANATMILDNLTIGGEPSIHAATAGTLVVRNAQFSTLHSDGRGGQLFLEDLAVGAVSFDGPQRVWLRQYNPESGRHVKLVNRGADVWVLGLKTEAFSTAIENHAPGRIEVLGGYVLGKGPSGRVLRDELLPMMVNHGGAYAVSVATRVGPDSPAFPIEMLDLRGGVPRFLLHEDTPRRSVERESVLPLAVGGPAAVADEAGGAAPFDTILAAPAPGADAAVVLTPRLPEGPYRIYARWPGGKDAAGRAPIAIEHAEGVATVTVNLRENGGAWAFLGSHALNHESRVVVRPADADGPVPIEAFRLVRADWIDPRLLPRLARRPLEAARPEDAGIIRRDRFDADLGGWTHLAGREFGGGTAGGLEHDPAQGRDGPGAAKLHVDASRAGRYGGAAADMSIAACRAVELWARSTEVRSFNVVLRDGSGQHHSHTVSIEPDGTWQRVTINDLASDRHWGGRNDGTWHGRLARIEVRVVPTAQPPHGTLWFDDVTLHGP